MKAKELRVGNLVNDVGSQPFKVAALCIVALVQCEAIGKIHLGYNPILLTEDWFLVFGLKKDHNNRYVASNWSGLCFEFKSQWYCYRYTNIGIIEITYGIKYVHQLQNLFFALTGEELTS